MAGVPALGGRILFVGAALQPGELIGRKLGEFEVLELIGQGAFGMVFRAVQSVLQRDAVVKIARFAGTEAATSKAVAKFLAEARLASRIDHPFAAHVYAFGAEPDGLLWIAMEFVRGTPLETLLEQQGPMPLERAVPLIRRLCEVVHQAHEQGIVHRDLKPANVMVVARGGTLFPKLLDLGVARDIHANAPEERGGPMGTPMYMAPEQWVNAKGVTAAADIYALGAVAYEMLTGAPLFAGDTVQAIAAQHALTTPPPLPAEFPEELSAAIARALAKKAADRFPTALAFGEAMLATSGIAADSFNLPALDEVTRDEVLVHGPQPIAEAVSAFEAVRTPLLARAALWQTARVMAKYVGLVALACRSRTGSGRLGDAPVVLELLATLRKKTLDTTQWWRLARELCRPFAAMPEVHPIPELVGLFFEGRAELKTPLDVLLESRVREPQGDATPEELRGFLVGAVPALGMCLRSLRFLHEYKLVVPQDGRDELWMGVRRPVRTSTDVVRPRSLTASIAASSVAGLAALRATISDQAAAVAVELGSGGQPRPLPGPVTAQIAAMAGAVGDATAQPLLVGASGVAVVSLWPLIQVEAPSPGYPLELFMLDGHGRHGARLVSVTDRLERSDEAVWPRLGLGSIDAELTGSLADDDAPPYRGLATFTEADAGMFFGREREVEGFVNRLATMPLIAVVGPSGAGKSSFVQAGVLPTLGPDWTSMVVRPGPAPFAALCARLAQRGVNVTPAQLRASPTALGTVLRRYADATGTSLLLVVDQFEELVTLCLDEVEQAAYAAALVQVATDDAPVRVVVTMRDDFMVRVAQLPALRHRLATSLQILTTPVAADLLRILTEPARRAGYGFEDEALPEEMVAEVANQPAALALLSFTAYQLWQYRDRHFKQLPRKAYRALGGVGGALAQHAEATLDGMSDADRAVVREVFRHLVTAEGTRAVLSRAELLQVAGGEAATSALEGLIQARLLVAMDRGGGESIEVVHEALLSAWPRLVQWRQEDAEGARLRDQLRVAARQWAERGRTRGLLWRGEALGEYTLWRKRYPGALTTIEDDFGRASVADAARGRRLRRGALIVVGAGLVIALIVFAGLRSQAEAARVTAEQNRRAAVASKAKAEASEAQVADQLTKSYVDRGRAASLAGDPSRSLVYLNEAMQRGVDTPGLRYMVARGLAALGDGVTTLRGHAGLVWDVAYVHGGARIATIGNDGTARIWDVATGHEQRRLDGHDHGGTPMVAWSRDDATLVTGDGLGAIRLWDAATGALRQTLAGHVASVTALEVSADGTMLLSSSDDGTVRVWSLATGAAMHVLPAPFDGVTAQARFAAGATRVVIAYNGPGFRPGTAALWTPATGAVVAFRGHTDYVWRAALDPRGRRLASVGRDRTVRIWDATTGAALRVLYGHDETVNDAAWAPDGRLATSSADGVIKLWQPDTGTLVFSLRGHQGRVHHVEFIDGGRALLSLGADGTARIWDATRGVQVASYMHGGFVADAEVRGDGQQLATASWRGTVKLWSLQQRELMRSLVGKAPADPYFEPPAISDDGLRLVRHAAGGIEIWNLADGTQRTIETPPMPWAPSVARDGKRIAVADTVGNVRVFDGEGGLVRTIAAATQEVASMKLAGNGALLVTASALAELAVWDVATGQRRAVASVPGIDDLMFAPGDQSVVALVVTPDERVEAQAFAATDLAPLGTLGTGLLGLYPGTQPGQIVFTTVSTALTSCIVAAEQAPRCHSTELGAVPNSVTVTPDGARALVAQFDGTVKVVDVASGAQIAAIAAHDVSIVAAAISGDGALAVTTGANGVVKVWNLGDYAELHAFRVASGTKWTGFALGGRAMVSTDGTAADLWSAERFLGEVRDLPQRLACTLDVALRGGDIVDGVRPTTCE